MRTDILINTITGDLKFQNTNKVKTYTFNWVTNGDVYLYGEIIIPYTMSFASLRNSIVKVTIPYTPVYKPVMIRFVNTNGETWKSNAVNGSEWLPISNDICASQFITVGPEMYCMQINDGNIDLYSGQSTDLSIGEANIQNRDMLLLCVPTNNYRYPLSGVGLINYSNAPYNSAQLANKLKTEFEADSVSINSAKWDSSTNMLALNLEYPDE